VYIEIVQPHRRREERREAEIWRSEEYRAFGHRVREWRFSPCIDCGGCEFRESNLEDCFGDEFLRCGECLWAAGPVQCP